MENVVILLLLLIVVGLAITPAIKHLKGQGGCCSGSDYKPRRKKLNKVIQKKKFKVEGMHCEHCSNRVTEAVNSISGVSAKVKLKPGIVIVSYADTVEDILIREAIESAGYKVVDK